MKNNNLQTQVFYDGACPVCCMEMDKLRAQDRAGRLSLIDIAAATLNEGAWPVSVADMNAAMHVRLHDGTWLKGMPAIRHIYTAIGRGWLLAPTGWPLISRGFDRAYAWFARNRRPLSARLGLNVCTDSACRIRR